MQFEDHHRAFLYELCDRTIAEENARVGADEAKKIGMAEAPDEMSGFSEGGGYVAQTAFR